MSGDAFGTWAVVEVMGHRRYAGFVTEQQVAGVGFVRVEVPELEPSKYDGAIPAHEWLFGACSIFSIQRTTERAARAAAAEIRAVPLDEALRRLEARQLALGEAEDSDEHMVDDYAATLGDDLEQDD